jgi:hypothetical protein
MFLSVFHVIAPAGFRTLIRAAPAAAVFALVLLISPGAPGAGIYKWVDDKGVTHYSESPPEGRASSTLKPPPAPPRGAVGAPTPKTWQEKEQEFQRRRAERGETETKRETQETEDRVAKDRRCRIAQNRLQVLQTQRPVYRFNAKGEREYYDDATRASEIGRVKDEIAATCN